MSDWPADIDPTPATKSKPAEQPQFTLTGLFLAIAAAGVFMAIARVLNIYWAVFYGVLFSLAWFNGRRDMTSRAKRVGVSAIVMLVILAMFLPAINTGRGIRHRASCQNNMREIAQAIISYQNAKGHLPPPYVADENGTPLYSWRVLILPYLERRDITALWRFDEPWDSPHNSQLQPYIEVFRCPNDSHEDPRQPLTNYVAVVGPGTAWEEDAKLSTASFKDGAGNTLLLVEIAESDIHWAEPRDLSFSKMPKTINPATGLGISSKHPGGTAAVFADKRVTFIREDTMPNVLKALLTRDGGETVNSSDFE